MTQAMKDKLIAVLYPARCAFCGKVILPQSGICSDCETEAQAVAGETCSLCAMPKERCSCGRRSHFYDAAAAAYLYGGVVKDGILRYKKGGDRRAAAFFAAEAARRYREAFDFPADLVTYIPQRDAERRKRSFHQARELAQLVARELELPLFDGMVKLYDVPPQKSVPYLYKRGNVAGIFDVGDPEAIRGKTVLLFDDVKTSGETLDECAKMLKLRGARTVVALSVAVTENKRKKKQTAAEKRKNQKIHT